MNVQQLREALAELPDWYEVQVVTDAEDETGWRWYRTAWAAEAVVECPEGATTPRVVIR